MMKNKEVSNKKISAPMFFVIQGTVCLYTSSGIAAKLASGYPFLSWEFGLCYGIEIVILGLYAVMWQQVIKRVDLSVAYANRSLSIFWSMLWAVWLFDDVITLNNIFGILLILVGTWMVNQDA